MNQDTWKSGTIVEQLTRAREANIPLLAFQTPDCAGTLSQLIKPWAKSKTVHIIVWDAANGARGLTAAATALLQDAVGYNPFDPSQPNDIKSSTLNPVEFCNVIGKLNPPKKEDFIAFAHNLHRYMLGGVQSDLQTATVTQALMNLRDGLKFKMSMMVLLGGSFAFSADVANSIEVCIDKYPDEAIIVRRIISLIETNPDTITRKPDADEMASLVGALRGLPLFTIDQALAVNVKNGAIDAAGVWETKFTLINNTRGLFVKDDPTTFNEIGGCKGIKDFMTLAIRAKRNAPRMIVYIDEVEKQMAGAGGGRGQGSDTSGVSQGVLGALLTFMEDKQTRGIIFVGHPGNGKSQIAKAAGSAGNIPVIEMRLSDFKASFVGATEENTRTALNMLEAMSDGQILFVATSNNIEALAPEFKARFSLGQYMFEFPNKAEREAIVNIWMTKLGLEGDDWKKVNMTDWTGREIRNLCQMVADYGLSFEAAAKKIIPVSRSGREAVARLRREAAGNYLSAETGEAYCIPVDIDDDAEEVSESARRILRRDED